jgi:serine/threonine protein kinase
MADRAPKYRFIRRLGSGGMAEVFEAAIVGAEGFERRVAIKRILPSLSGDETFAGMFVNEARISSSLRLTGTDELPDGALLMGVATSHSDVFEAE